MKKTISISILLVTALFLLSCKKNKKDSEPTPSPTPPGPTDTYNPPPASGDYYFFIDGANNPTLSWTKNFTDFRIYSSKLDGVNIFGFGNDTIVVYKGGTIYFGNVYNPSEMKTITCSKYVQYLSCINNVVVCYAVDGNNYYLGSCDYKNGERDITFNLLTVGETITSPIQHAGNELLAGGYNSSASLSFLAVSRNGKNWSYKGVPSSFPTTFNSIYKNYGNAYYAINPYFVKTTIDTSFASGSWSNTTFNSGQNTSDTAGYFNNDVLRKVGVNWISYGSVYSSASGNYIPAKNISTDNGATFTTTLLTGLPIKSSFYSFAFTKTHVLAYIYDSVANNGSYLTYVSSDFVNFSLATIPYVNMSTLKEVNYFE